MAPRRYALRDDQWNLIKDLLPGRIGHAGGTAVDNRLFVEAVLYRYRAGVAWRDLPERKHHHVASPLQLPNRLIKAYDHSFSLNPCI